ncbi:LysR family transcriptional regulator [Mesobacterium pallidum]|uniref:LysR family transcriptional regulator n=1 Tax=Mesobacterium pallidum TaxID=2872037 RepID=UPI001EE22438|nr:LysR family transcriptional regulator [Mesobacterium pallidum]
MKLLYESPMSIQHLTLKQLRALSAVYRTGKLTDAAGELHVTQSAVSVLIKQVESALDVRLFDRTTRRLEPTVACENAIGTVERILDDVRLLDHSVRDMRDLKRGTVRLTATPATGMAFLPEVVRRFRAAFPAIRLVIDDCAPNQFLTNIAEEKVEFGLGVAPEDPGQFDSVSITSDQLCCVLPKDHALAGRDSLRWSDIAGEPLILSRRDYGVRDLVDRVLQQETGQAASVAAEVGFLSSATWMATSGIGVCILPERLARLYFDATLSVVPLTAPRVMRPMSLVTKAGRSLTPASQRFVEVLQGVFDAPG